MDTVLKAKSARWHTIYSVISTVIEAAALAAALIWLLPVFGVDLSWWWILIILVVFIIYSYIMYRIGHPTVLYEPVTAPESIVGNEGLVESNLDPEGYVRVHGELWKASSSAGPLAKGEEVIVTKLDGMKLTVEKKSRRAI
jgi:membrane protein implicated in regulation of membrane protease activity